MVDILAYDRVGTVRTTDEDGRLKIARTPISKANVCPYRGREIPGYIDLGLDPDKMYDLFRDPVELEKGSSTFNGLPVLEEHFHANADNPRRDLVVGTTGDSAEFKAPYLYNNLTVWDGEAIERIKTGEQRELSSCYRYRADMTPGMHDGEKYDGVMRDIRGSHIAIVPSGRAGPDVLVADSKLTETGGSGMIDIDKLIEALKPFLAADADVEACKKAMDAACANDDDVTSDNDGDLEEDAKRKLQESRIERLKAAGFSPDEIEKMCGSLASDEGEEEAEENEREGMKREMDRKDRERNRDDRDAERDDKAEDDDDEEEKKRAVAMDAAVRQLEKRLTRLHRATSEVAPVVGEVAFDSAEETYSFALKKMGVSTSGVHPSAYRSMFTAVSRAQNKATAPVKPKLAMDSDATASLFKRFPGLSRIS